MSNQYYRGSEWRKWDLHVHTPLSICQNYWWETKFEDFIIALENLPEDVKVIWINDYYFIDGYKKVMEYKTQWRLSNIEKIFPILEFRIDTFSSASENKFQKINLHILFDINEENLEKEINMIQNEFISQIKLSKHHPTKVLSRDNFISESSNNNLQTWFSEITPSTEEIIKLLSTETWKSKTFIFLWYVEWNNLNKNNQLKPEKKNLYNLTNAFFTASDNDNITKKEEVLFWFWNKPLLHSLDIHDFSKLDTNNSDEDWNKTNSVNYKCFTWIKADPTFEWLKQIIYEPAERVFIWPNKPEEKTGYQAIDRIEVSDDNIENTEILFNQNLNTIIWWRSTGKSILLAAIAKKLKLENIPKFADEYETYINNISNNIKVFWKDWKENYEREVEYFQQSYMYDLSRNREWLNKIIEKILKQKWKDVDMNSYDEFVNENKNKISSQISDLFQIVWDISKTKQLLLDTWDKEWVEKEIKKLEAELKKNATINITDEEKITYEEQKKSLEDIKNTKEKNVNDITNLEKLRQQDFIKETIDYELVWISNNDRKQEISLFYDEIKKDFKDKWTKKIKEIKTKVESENKGIDKEIKKIEDDLIYKKVSKAFAESVQLKEIESKIKIQKTKLSQIDEYSKKLTNLESQKKKLIENIKKQYNKFSDEAKKIIKKLSDKVDWLEIQAKIRIKETEYKEILKSSLNNVLNENKSALSKDSKDIFDVFDDLINWKLVFTAWNNAESLTKRIMTEDLNKIDYELIYEKDTFWQMSDGKKAFVVLKLLLDFSDKECPILIDQPEDDLDNRSICSELVEYLKKKKKQRQIIVATHNPNVVVTADAEEIIVANQDGTWVANKNWKKFQYISWSLEYTEPLDKSILKTSILDSQWINEHVCDIVEWWKIAFQQRENKYNI